MIEKRKMWISIMGGGLLITFVLFSIAIRGTGSLESVLTVINSVLIGLDTGGSIWLLFKWKLYKIWNFVALAIFLLLNIWMGVGHFMWYVFNTMEVGV